MNNLNLTAHIFCFFSRAYLQWNTVIQPNCTEGFQEEKWYDIVNSAKSDAEHPSLTEHTSLFWLQQQADIQQHEKFYAYGTQRHWVYKENSPLIWRPELHQKTLPWLKWICFSLKPFVIGPQHFFFSLSILSLVHHLIKQAWTFSWFFFFTALKSSVFWGKRLGILHPQMNKTGSIFRNKTYFYI